MNRYRSSNKTEGSVILDTLSSVMNGITGNQNIDHPLGLKEDIHVIRKTLTNMADHDQDFTPYIYKQQKKKNNKLARSASPFHHRF